MSMTKYKGHILIGLFFGLVIVISSGLYFLFPKKAYNATRVQNNLVQKDEYPYLGKHILISLDNMTLLLKNGTTTEKIVKIVSIGKPGKYYETIGGIYENDYKEEMHFSSIGHVFMPYSVHVFGNFFIHGIPFYESGEKVSSEYSGGCIRINDDDSKYVFDFIEKGTPIIISSDGSPYAFTTKEILSSENKISDNDMRRFMVAIISLEFLKQDNTVFYNNASTTNRTLLNNLLIGKDDGVAQFYAKNYNEELFVKFMNEKAQSIGLKDTEFYTLLGDTKTNDEDKALFVNYLKEYKDYLFVYLSKQN